MFKFKGIFVSINSTISIAFVYFSKLMSCLLDNKKKVNFLSYSAHQLSYAH